MNQPVQPQELLRIFDTAYALLNNGANWIQRNAAQDSEGYDCDPRGEDAVCFCSWGALVAADKAGVLWREDTQATPLGLEVVSSLNNASKKIVPYHPFTLDLEGEPRINRYIRFNDSTSWEKVDRMWKLAREELAALCSTPTPNKKE